MATAEFNNHSFELPLIFDNEIHKNSPVNAKEQHKSSILTSENKANEFFIAFNAPPLAFCTSCPCSFMAGPSKMSITMPKTATIVKTPNTNCLVSLLIVFSL